MHGSFFIKDFMLELWTKYFAIYFFSMLKFIGGPLSGTAFGFHWIITALFTIAGMMTSVLIFSLFGSRAKKWIKKRWFKKSRLFTPRNRRAVNIWKKYGLAGVAFLTPILFTPIGGTLLATSFGETTSRIFIYMLCSALFWGLLLSFLTQQFGEILHII